MGRHKIDDIAKRTHRIELKLNKNEHDMLEKLTEKRGFKTKTQTLRDALRHDFIFYLKGREDGYYKR